MKARIKSAAPELADDFLTIEPLDGPRLRVVIAQKLDRRRWEHSDITIDIGDLYRALKRAGIEIDTVA
jgi:hypothetical protein